MVDQPAGLGRFDVAAGGLVDNITGPVCSNLGREGGQAVTEASTGLDPNSALQNNVVDQPAGLGLFDVAAGGLVDNISRPICNNLGIEGGQAVTHILKPKSIWTRFNRMDFGLGGLSKALMLPARGKRVNDSVMEEVQCEILGSKEPKRVRVGNGDDVDNVISTGVESHPCRE